MGQSQRRLGHELHVDVGLPQHEERVVVVDLRLLVCSRQLVDFLARLEGVLHAVQRGGFAGRERESKPAARDERPAALAPAFAVCVAFVQLVPGD